jgi:hypothetical protein
MLDKAREGQLDLQIGRECSLSSPQWLERVCPKGKLAATEQACPRDTSCLLTFPVLVPAAVPVGDGWDGTGSCSCSRWDNKDCRDA